MDYTADRQRPILLASFAFELKIERSLVAAANALDASRSKNRFCIGGGQPKVFKFVTAIHKITIHKADMSDRDLPEVHRLGFVVVDC